MEDIKDFSKILVLWTLCTIKMCEKLMESIYFEVQMFKGHEEKTNDLSEYVFWTYTLKV